ncbi:MAG: bifunctional alpha,alpha-trehalose-phosphate synthase (UDP-forming)/trehalose-phosphatase [Candidatus Riflebacteria bacterium]|nr:bifunctional alpha,alpha-trehalose-phosphate synthase (UDP-forming)/trehalose-phosphatase [Candidatus Riflebacteria bacterium]
MGRLLIVSNRLPVSTKVEHGKLSVVPSAGGLATGLKGPHEESGGLWIGWPGDTSRLDKGQIEGLERELLDLRAVPCYLSPGEVRAYYDGVSNGFLWPLFHYLLDKIPYSTSEWDAYRQVNERFATLTANHYRPGDTVWVHDYQLALVPSLLREMIPEARIGFFLHIPFPATEVFRIFPWREELLLGLLGADLVGFHTLSYARHFGNSLIHILGLTPDVDRVRSGGRTVRFGAYPMGIDFITFDRLARTESVRAEVARLRYENQDLRLLLGVDRLDYTKGIPRRLLSIERLLQKHPELRGRVRLIQVAVPSREHVDEYESFTSEVNGLVGRINGAFGTATSTPVHYLHQSVSQKDLLALYAATDVMLVTPLRDGMNLVAKEFVAARTDEDGVLVLSEFAGAAAEMAGALLVNPYNVDAIADATRVALLLPEQERRARMRAMRQRIEQFDVHRWARTFLGDLRQENDPGSREAGVRMDREVRSQLLERVARAHEVLLLLDYDGTLTPYTRRPDLASPDKDLLDLLASLSGSARARVHIISGRSRGTLESWLGQLPIGLHAEHGLWSRPVGGEWALCRPVDASWKQKVLEILGLCVERTPGSMIEEKSFSLAWHYRMCDPEFAEWQARELKLHLTHALSNVPVAVLSGDKVVEVQPHGVNKGLVAAALCGAHPGALAIAAGDDETDEHLFAALPEGAISIHVGSRASRAHHNIRDTVAMRRFLMALASSL